MCVNEILERARINKNRVRIWYGDDATGNDWLEEFDVVGRVGRSTGINKIHILLHNSRSIGGPAILTRRIVKIAVKHYNRWIIEYEHDSYRFPRVTIADSEIPGYAVDVFINGKKHATFSTVNKYQRWYDFMTGRRFSK